MAKIEPESLSELIRQQKAFRAAQRREPRYDLDAYTFVCESVDFTCRKLGERRDVSGAELLDGICDLALERFALLAPLVLERWGISTTDDFGRIVFALVEVGMLGKSPRDRLKDFHSVFDLREELERRYHVDLDA
jgi:uncharacterized repeat protein (TIGR04138 family)